MVKKYNPSASFQNAMFGSGKKSKREKKLIRKNPYGDFDRDGIVNFLDCKPYNKNRHISSQQVFNKVSSWFAPPKPAAPAPTSTPSQGVSVGGITWGPTGTVTAPAPFTGTPTVISYPSGGGGGTSGGGGAGVTVTTTPTLKETVAETKIDEKKLIKEVEKEKELKKLELGSGVVSAYQPLTPQQKYNQQLIQQQNIPRKFIGGVKYVGNKLGVLNLTGAITSVRDFFIEGLTGTIGKGEKEIKTEEFPYKVPKVSYTTQLNLTKPLFTTTPTIYTPEQKTAQEFLQTDIYSGVRAETNVKNSLNDLTDKYQQQANEDAAKIQQNYNEGKINYDTAVNLQELNNNKINKKFETEANSKIKSIIDKETDLNKSQKTDILNKYKEQVKILPWQEFAGAGLMTASWYIPYAGKVFQAADITGMVASTPGTISAFKSAPLQTTKQMLPSLVGGIIGAGIVGGIKNSITNTRLKTEAVAKQKNLKLTSEISINFGKAIKIGTDYAGNSIYRVKGTTVTKILNKKTGKIVDKSVTTSSSDVIAGSSGDAIKAIVKDTSQSLRNGGIRNYKDGKTTIKVDVAKSKGIYDVYSSGENTFVAYGKTGGIRMGEARGKVKLKEGGMEIYTKARLDKLAKSDAMLNAVFNLKESYPEIKNIKGRKVKGIESIYEGKATSDFYKNLYDVKKYKRTVVQPGFPVKVRVETIKKYVRKPAKEPKPIRDIGLAFQKLFVPQAFVEGGGQQITLTGTKLKKLTKRTGSEVAAKLQARAVAQAFSLKRIKQIKTTPPKIKLQTLSKTKVFGSGVINSLIGRQEVKRVTITKPSYKYGMISRIRTKQINITREKDKYRFENLGVLLAGTTNVNERYIEQTGTAQIPRQSQQQIQQQQQKLRNVLGFITPMKIPPINLTYPSPKVPKPKIPIVFSYYKKPTPKEVRRIKAQEKKRQKEIRKYQASVGSWSLGIYGKKGKRYKAKGWTGGEIRPIEIDNSGYSKRLNKVFSLQ